LLVDVCQPELLLINGVEVCLHYDGIVLDWLKGFEFNLVISLSAFGIRDHEVDDVFERPQGTERKLEFQEVLFFAKDQADWRHSKAALDQLSVLATIDSKGEFIAWDFLVYPWQFNLDVLLS